jgi:hypothetical protein
MEKEKKEIKFSLPQNESKAQINVGLRWDTAKGISRYFSKNI